MSLPSPKKARLEPMPKPPTAAERAAVRLGPQDGLAVLEKNTRELADYYLARAGVKQADPDTQTTANYLAITRRDQHLLLTQIEEDLQRMVLDGKAETPAEARMKAVQNGRHKKVNDEIRRLHVLAAQLYRDLEDAAEYLDELSD